MTYFIILLESCLRFNEIADNVLWFAKVAIFIIPIAIGIYEALIRQFLVGAVISWPSVYHAVQVLILLCFYYFNYNCH